ncbi:MAG: hypothetical protein ACXVJK_00430 [Candidatus Aminicenantales bacterium]
MPEPMVILAGLGRIANDNVPLAIVWHIIFGMAIILLVARWRPSRRLAMLGLTIPLVSVAVLAFTHGNPFNGIVFLLGAISLAATAARKGTSIHWGGAAVTRAIGAVMVLFGWIYPHFLQGSSPLRYLYAAPTGLIPCPTLSIVIGFALLSGGVGNRAWALLLAALGVFYGLFGAFRLGVGMDVLLLLGGITLVVMSFRRPSPTPAPRA